MRNFFLFSLAYLAFAVALVILVRDDTNIGSLLALPPVKGATGVSFAYLGTIAAILALIFWKTNPSDLRHRITPTLYAIAGCIAVVNAFSLIKTSIPKLVPFYADETFAKIDRLLHFGVDPWEFTHSFGSYVTSDLAVFVYVTAWLPFAVFLPVLLIWADNDAERVKRFTFLFLASWIVLGNVAAMMGSSVGPVFYDRLMDAERFASLQFALHAADMNSSLIGDIQSGMWENYTQSGQAIGTGISAFPSKHVAIATIIALYMAERHRYLGMAGIVMLAVVLFFSVYTGYHYAIDGYASILMVTGLWAFQRRRHVAFASTAAA